MKTKRYASYQKKREAYLEDTGLYADLTQYEYDCWFPTCLPEDTAELLWRILDILDTNCDMSLSEMQSFLHGCKVWDLLGYYAWDLIEYTECELLRILIKEAIKHDVVVRPKTLRAAECIAKETKAQLYKNGAMQRKCAG